MFSMNQTGELSMVETNQFWTERNPTQSIRDHGLTKLYDCFSTSIFRALVRNLNSQLIVS